MAPRLAKRQIKDVLSLHFVGRSAAAGNWPVSLAVARALSRTACVEPRSPAWIVARRFQGLGELEHRVRYQGVTFALACI